MINRVFKKLFHIFKSSHGDPNRDMADQCFKDYEPVFLLDHLQFGSKYRLFSASSLDNLVESHKPDEDSETFKLAVVHAFKEEMNSYEDLGAILLAVRNKFKKDIPILQTLIDYRTEKAIIGKLTARHNSQRFKSEFYLDELVNPDFIPPECHKRLEAVRTKISEIVVDGFKNNSSTEKYDAFLRIKHGPMLVSTARIYAGKKYGDHSNNYPGFLIKSSKVGQRKKQLFDNELKQIPFVPFCLKNTMCQFKTSLLMVDICTRIQHLLIVCYLQRFHEQYISAKRLNQRMLFDMGMDLYKLLEQLPDAKVRT